MKTTLFKIGIPIVINATLSLFLLPFIISPNNLYPFGHLPDVLFWQAVAFFGWPYAVFGFILSLFFGSYPSGLFSFVQVLIYPAMQLFLFFTIKSEKHRRKWLICFHSFLTLSFAAVWLSVLDGYNFMSG